MRIKIPIFSRQSYMQELQALQHICSFIIFEELILSRESQVTRHGAAGRDMFSPALLLRSLEHRAEIAGCCVMQRFETDQLKKRVCHLWEGDQLQLWATQLEENNVPELPKQPPGRIARQRQGLSTRGYIGNSSHSPTAVRNRRKA